MNCKQCTAPTNGVAGKRPRKFCNETCRSRFRSSQIARAYKARKKRGGVSARRITLPADLVEAINKYLSTPWSDGRDPSNLGALNAACYIGERVAALCESVGPTVRKASAL